MTPLTSSRITKSRAGGARGAPSASRRRGSASATFAMVRKTLGSSLRACCCACSLTE
jgi:hypothetical protein